MDTSFNEFDPEIIVSEDEIDYGITALVKATEQLPSLVAHIAVDSLIPFPGVIYPLLLTKEVVATLEYAKANGSFVGLFMRPQADSSVRGQTGVIATIIKDFVLPDGEHSVLLKVIRRAYLEEEIERKMLSFVKLSYPNDYVSNPEKVSALDVQLRGYLSKFIELHPHLPDELKVSLYNVTAAGDLCDLIAQQFVLDKGPRMAILSAFEIDSRLQLCLSELIRQIELLTIGNKITKEIQEKVERHQKEFYLREQLKAIKVELGEDDDGKHLKELKKRVNQSKFPAEIREKVQNELDRLDVIPMESPEYHGLHNYVDWMVSLPWQTASTTRIDIHQAHKRLEEDHYGLQDVKDRILEHLAVHALNSNANGTILCFAGPPGVGKTSLGQSIARALGREFYRLSLGGMRDEAEIKGHRRTYVGALPGKIIQGIRVTGKNNPVFMLDEIDKLGKDWRGDPSSALLEVLDPAQNHKFWDHYLDVPFDLSAVMFIATANIKAEIPTPLLDRMEIIDLPGYLLEEKLSIAKKHLIRRQRRAHGLNVKHFRLSNAVLKRVISEYTHEAGVRGLERQIAKLCRKQAVQLVSHNTIKDSIRLDNLDAFLGVGKQHTISLKKAPKVGVAIGLAWTPHGGEVLKIEVASLLGNNRLQITGHLGEIMKESVNIALTNIRSQLQAAKHDHKSFTDKDLHIHFPAGAVPKDGPSAGITVACALYSSFTNKRMKARTAMTGELSLQGDVLPVGGIREKIIAARKAGANKIILPEDNRKEAQRLPSYVVERVNLCFVKQIDEVLDYVFGAARAKN